MTLETRNRHYSLVLCSAALFSAVKGGISLDGNSSSYLSYRSARNNAAWTFSDVRGSSVTGKLNEIVMELVSTLTSESVADFALSLSRRIPAIYSYFLHIKRDFYLSIFSSTILKLEIFLLF